MTSRKGPVVHVQEGTWYKLAFGGPPFVEECCGCGLVHRVKYKLEDGTLWQQFIVDKRRTERARAKRNKKV